MRVLFLTHSFVRYPGDFAGNFLFTLAKALVNRSVTISVVSPHQANLPLYQEIEAIKIYRFRYAPGHYENLAYRGNMHQLVKKNIINKLLLFNFLAAFATRSYNIAKNRKIEILHCHWWIPAGLMGAVIARLSNIPLVVTVHGTDIRLLGHSGSLRLIAQFVLQTAQAITVSSSYLLQEITGLFPSLGPKIIKIPIPVELELSRPLITNHETPVHHLISIARLSSQKGLNFLIDACARLKSDKIAFNLSIIGEGEERERLSRQIQYLKLTNEVILLGEMPHNKIGEYLAKADLFILPSVQEGFGVGLIEALLCKKPVIGTNSGGIPDIIKDGETGLLVPPKDPVALAEAIKLLLRNKRLARRLAKNGYQYVRANFTPERVAEQMLQVYQAVLKQ